MIKFKEQLEQYRHKIDLQLENLLSVSPCLQQPVYDAMQYSISAGGKRIRPILTLEFFRLCGGNPDEIMPFACALEMIHTYSLIHDDLPCMDDDDLRRGKPSCHKVFGEATALLAGDALLNLAFETMLTPLPSIPADRQLAAARTVGHLCGSEGMIGGQVIDLSYEGKPITREILMRLYEDKTAALLRAGAVSGAYLAGADAEQVQAADEYAHKIGLAFQIIDDILDCVGDEKVLGKPIGSDKKNQKKTYVDFYGIDGAQKAAEGLTLQALKALEFFPEHQFLTTLSEALYSRKK